VGRPFAEGGYAVVFAAERVSDGLPLVIKALKEDASQADPVAVQRFIREAEVASKLVHPNIVRTFSIGQTRDGVLYMVMERLEGKPLVKLMYKRPLGLAVTKSVLEQVLTGLESAHAQGVVHRDIKPSNVFVCERQRHDDPHIGVCKLLDFGFVKLLPHSEVTPSHGFERSEQPLTVVGQRVGTPGYMAPEMLLKGVVTVKTDLYSLGVMAYEMLSAKLAFSGTPLERARQQMLGEPEPLPETLRKLAISQFIERLMAKNPEQRPASARAALDELQGLDSGAIVVERPSGLSAIRKKASGFFTRRSS
jgi:serine/threonine-protein kinase